MAERKQGAQDPEVRLPTSADEAKAAAPEPDEKSRAQKKIYAVQAPTNEFVIEGLPVITTEGTPLTADQAEQVKKIAPANGVVIVEKESE
jgi:hypothetical protein